MEKQDFFIAGNQVIAKLAGNLQGTVAAQVRETLLQYIEDGYACFKIDFSNVHNIDATGLGILVTIQKRTLQHGGNIVLEGLHDSVKIAFERTRLSKAFTIAA